MTEYAGILLAVLAVVAALVFLGILFWRSPQTIFRFIFWIISLVFYRVRIEGQENIPAEGGVLLISNHVSWIDGFLLLLASPRPIRPVAFAANFSNPFLNWLARHCGLVLLGTRPKELLASLREAQEILRQGEIVCLFPEGGISRTGQVQAFQRGLMKILEGTGAVVVPAYLDEVFGSVFSYSRGSFLWKWPRAIPYSVSIHIGLPIAEVRDVHTLRQAILDLGAQAMQARTDRMTPLPQAFIRQCQRRLFTSKAADSLGADLTGGEMLTRSLILRRLLNRGLLAEEEQYIGILLAPSVPGVLANTAVTLDRRVAVNLNYTVSEEVINDCIRQCGIRHVITSRRFMEKVGFTNIEAELIYLEDFKEAATWYDKALCAFQAYAVPASMLEWQLGLGSIQPDDVMTIIFTSGSTGSPKGVMLTYANVAHNTQAIDEVVQLNPTDVLLGILPFFHSFGYTVTLWTAMGLDVKGAYHFNPLEPRQVGKLCQEHGGTILLSTPTFLRSYLRRCTEEEFASLDVVVAGAEKMPPDLAEAFEAKFKVRPVEGYGTTELAPLVSVNIPPSRSRGNFQVDRKEGSVGRPVPGVSAKVVDLDTGAVRGVNEPGMLLITGANVMKGYLNRPEATAEVMRDGWYVTGDVARIDEEGFIHITGRESRFSKIGGEMVPHIQVEEAINRLVAGPDAEELKAAVTAVHDQRKGERLVVLHTKIDKSPQEVVDGLRAAGLPNLFVPGADSFVEVESLPVLGTGKLDLRGIKQVAEERFGAARSTT